MSYSRSDYFTDTLFLHRYIDSQLTGVKDLVCNGLVTKTVGSSSKQRVLVLTKTPLLVYMVPDTGEIKGEIDWTATVYAKLVDGTQDHFKVTAFFVQQPWVSFEHFYSSFLFSLCPTVGLYARQDISFSRIER